MYGGLFDLADEERRHRLEALGWKRVEQSPGAPPLWRNPDGDGFTEDEAFLKLAQIEGEAHG